jgi:hypothetical protein
MECGGQYLHSVEGQKIRTRRVNFEGTEFFRNQMSKYEVRKGNKIGKDVCQTGWLARFRHRSRLQTSLPG